MIEVNLFKIAQGDARASVGKCIARNRFDKESLGVTIESFVQGFLKDNLDKFEGGIGSPELVDMINSDATLTRRDISCINYYLVRLGLIVKVFNVTDDEENSTGVPAGIVEWNVIDRNFIQYDYPTSIKIIPADNVDIPAVLRQVAETHGLFDSDKFSGIKNPLTTMLDNLDNVKRVTGAISADITTKLYDILDELGISIFCATPED